MAKVYAELIRMVFKSLDHVPDVIRSYVQSLLAGDDV